VREGGREEGGGGGREEGGGGRRDNLCRSIHGSNGAHQIWKMHVLGVYDILERGKIFQWKQGHYLGLSVLDCFLHGLASYSREE
jgi:hypothetical protein